MPESTPPIPLAAPSKNHPVVHAILSRWRRLTGGRAVRDPDRRTLIACSGGADSSALVLALAHSPASIVVAHIVHDMRSAPEAAQCLASAQSLAQSLSLPFVSAEISAKSQGINYEAAARNLRYEALAKLAQQSGCRYIATGHHAEDQLETLLLRLMRGAGPQGLAAIRAKRTLANGLTVIRPMLAISRADAQALCREARWQWSDDATNADLSHARAALRAKVLPGLLELAPSAAKRAAETAHLASLTARHLENERETLHAAAAVPGTPNTFDRRKLKAADQIVLLTWLRSLDTKSPLRTLESAARAIHNPSGECKAFTLGNKVLTVQADQVSVVAKSVAP